MSISAPDSLKSWGIDRNWCLFLDRDGVINRRLPDAYVRNWGEFEFLPGVLEAMKVFADLFAVIVVVTNQRGIGRGLMSEADLEAVHQQMLAQIRDAGGRLDRIYHCPHDRTAQCDCRKPEIGMALRARSEFQRIDFSRSIMVGDATSDMVFAQRAGLRRIWIGQEPASPSAEPAHIFPDLRGFAQALRELSSV